MSAEDNDKEKRRKGQEERDCVWETLRAIKGAGEFVLPCFTTCLAYAPVTAGITP